MTVSLGLAFFIFVAIALVFLLGSGLDFFRERSRQQHNRERWEHEDREGRR